MKKSIIMSILIMMIAAIVPLVSAQDNPDIQMSLLKQDPYPAEPGKDVLITLKIENRGNADAENVRLKIVASYPFSSNDRSVKISSSSESLTLDGDNEVSLGKLPAGEYILVDYRVAVAQNAVEGDNILEIRVQPSPSSLWISKSFTLLIQGKNRFEIALVPSIISPGKPTNVTFVITNSGTASVKDLALLWSVKDNSIIPLGSSNIKYASSLGPGKTVSLPFVIVTSPEADIGAYTITANLSYTVGSGTVQILPLNLGLFVGGEADFDVSLQESKTGSLSIAVANTGTVDASSVSVTLPKQAGVEFSGASTVFLGDLEPGDFTLATFSANTDKNQAVDVVITYTTASGERKTVQKAVDIYTTENGEGTDEESSSGRRGLTFALIGVVGIVAVLIAIKYGRRMSGARAK